LKIEGGIFRDLKSGKYSGVNAKNSKIYLENANFSNIIGTVLNAV
jgi:hypothetical protein